MRIRCAFFTVVMLLTQPIVCLYCCLHDHNETQQQQAAADPHAHHRVPTENSHSSRHHSEDGSQTHHYSNDDRSTPEGTQICHSTDFGRHFEQVSQSVVGVWSTEVAVLKPVIVRLDVDIWQPDLIIMPSSPAEQPPRLS